MLHSSVLGASLGSRSGSGSRTGRITPKHFDEIFCFLVEVILIRVIVR
jgi:hypothetical protein